MQYSIIPSVPLRMFIIIIDMKRLIYILGTVILLASCTGPSINYGQTVRMSEDEMMDRIRGGWFAQTIGCTYGGPTEFKFKGGLMQDAEPIFWSDS